MRTSIKIDFSLLSVEQQKEVYHALAELESAVSTLESIVEASFQTLDEVYCDLEEVHGDEHSLVSLLHSLKAHVEGITAFNVTDNFDKDEKEAFTVWYEKMSDSD